ncbi:MAG: hypothetical protein LQ346_006626 [Caloplaca aetnensis]|nr:MAG: hypothetical protein LQ346_006626 [Caloplaca aetnensis]
MSSKSPDPLSSTLSSSPSQPPSSPTKKPSSSQQHASPSQQPSSPVKLSTSSPKPRARLRLNQKSPPDELIFEANALLSSGNSRQAIELYTQVLYDAAPGHIVAFLNRSLAYAYERRYELAATDAYRAFTSINALKAAKRPGAQARALETKRYLRLEMLMSELGRDWTQGEQRYIAAPATAWPRRALASIVINTEDEDCPVWHEVDIEHILPRLELRAIFRLAGALFDMRGGTAQEAAGLLDDMASSCKMYDPEKACFKDLGDGIALTLSAFKDFFLQNGKETDDEHVMLLPLDGVDVPRTTPNAMLKTRSTLAPALQYWDDKYEPDFAKTGTYLELGNLISDSSDSCAPLVSDQSSIGLCPKTELRASKDHLPGDPILYERRSWGVSTCTPDKVLDSWEKTKTGCLRLYCDTCATALLVPEDLAAYVLAEGSREASTTTQDMHDLRRTVHYPNMSDEQQEKRLKWSIKTHISMCSPEHEAIYCCTTCRKHRRVFDFGVHDSKIESELRDEKIKTVAMPLENVGYSHPRSAYCHSKTQTLYDLLFLRIYASALNEDEHPLELVKFVNGGLSRPSAHTPNKTNNTKPNEMPWSFQNNIVRPIWIVHRYHESLEQDPFRYLKQSDGWVINTLLAKIQRSAIISAGAMSAIILNIDKLEKTYCYRGLEPWVSDKYDTIYESEEQFNDVWVARLDPLVSMIRVADEAKGEKPNCWLKYEEGVRVIAGQPDDPSNKRGFAIKQGEVLLRAKPKFLGGSPYEVLRHTQRDAKPEVKRTKSVSPGESRSPVKEESSAGRVEVHRGDNSGNHIDGHSKEQRKIHSKHNSGVYDKDQGERDDDDHSMLDAVIERTEPKRSDEPTFPEVAEVASGSESLSKSDEEMLDILDEESSSSSVEPIGEETASREEEQPRARAKGRQEAKPRQETKPREEAKPREDAKPREETKLRKEGLRSSRSSSPVNTLKTLLASGNIASLDGQAESINMPTKPLPSLPPEEPMEGEMEVDEWEDVDIRKRQLGARRRRLSGYPDRPPETVDYRTVDIRRSDGYWPPRNSLQIRHGIHRRLPPQPRQQSQPSTSAQDKAKGDAAARKLLFSAWPLGEQGEPLLTGASPGSLAMKNLQALQGMSHGLPLPEQESDLDAWGDPPVSNVVRSGFMLDRSEPPTVGEATRALEMRSVVDMRRGRPLPEQKTSEEPDKEETDEKAEKEGKEKGGLRGGDAWFTVCDGASDEDEL